MIKNTNTSEYVVPGNTRLIILICVFLSLITLVVFWQVHTLDFVSFDDPEYITDNEHVQSEFTRESFIWALTTTHFPYWHPITWLSHMLDYQVYGLNAGGHHVTNLFFHILNAILLFLVLLRMTGSIWRSSFVAAIFTIHPLSVESVAWITERKNVLSTLFWLLTMLTYVRYVENNSFKRYSFVVLFFALGLMTKPMVVTLPFVLLMLDYWPLGRMRLGQKIDENLGVHRKSEKIPKLIWEKIPLLILVVGSCASTVIVQKTVGALATIESFSIQARFVNALFSYSNYLKTMIWPVGLAGFYPHPGDALPVWYGVASSLALVAITVLVWRKILELPFLAFGWFWYLGTLVPVIGVVQAGQQASADRFTYIPIIGILIIIAWGVPKLLNDWNNKKLILSACAGILIPVLMVITSNQVGYWKNSITLFERSISVADIKFPNLVIAYNNLGNALLEEGRYEDATLHYREAIKVNPNYFKPYNNLGSALAYQGLYEEAIAPYSQAIRMNPEFIHSYTNLGNVFIELNNYDEAIVFFRKAIEIDSRSSEAYTKLVNSLEKLERYDEVVSTYRQIIINNPDNAKTYLELGNALSNLKLYADAIEQFQKAISIDAKYAEAYGNLADALVHMGKSNDSIPYYKDAIRFRSDYVNAHYNLAVILGQRGQFDEAVIHFERVVNLDPKNLKAQKNLKLARSLVEKISK